MDGRLTKLKRQRIEKVYTEEPYLEVEAFMERFGVSRDTIRDIMSAVDRKLKRLRRKNKNGHMVRTR